MKQQKAVTLTLMLFFTALHTLHAQRTNSSSRARQQVANKVQVVATNNTAEKVIKWNRDLYNIIDYTNFRTNPIFLQAIDFDNPDYALINACLFFMINEERAKVKKTVSLQYAPQLEITAWNHSRKMGEEDGTLIRTQ
jgi:hypothetical protein